jgi:hypothetical protein
MFLWRVFGFEGRIGWLKVELMGTYSNQPDIEGKGVVMLDLAVEHLVLQKCE